MEAPTQISSGFSIVDYVTFGLMLLVSACIGLYFGFFKKTIDTEDYLVAGRSMPIFPVLMSMIASVVSAISLLGITSDVYVNGTHFWIQSLAFILLIPIIHYVMLPPLLDLKIMSAHEYLGRRFNTTIRRLASILFILRMLTYMAIAIYAPSLALSQVTGINLYVSVTATLAVCIFYTTIGGMKAVLWTDVVQISIVFGSLAALIIKGTIEEGGFTEILNVNNRGNRTVLIDWDPDPRTRHTFWSIVFGTMVIYGNALSTGQEGVQRYFCLRERWMVKWTVFLTSIGLALVVVICVYIGMIIYSRYHICDPLKADLITNYNQLFPFLIMDLIGAYRGVPGLFVAAIFSAALSTVSSGMNCITACFVEDFLKDSLLQNRSKKFNMLVSKGFSFLNGLAVYGLVFIVENFGNVISASMAVNGVFGGITLATFVLGMVNPKANSKGTLIGIACGFGINIWLITGAKVALFRKDIVPGKLPINICLNNGSHIPYGDPTTSFTSYMKEFPASQRYDDTLTEIYKIDYFWYSVIGFLLTTIVGSIASICFRSKTDAEVNPILISPSYWKIKSIFG